MTSEEISALMVASAKDREAAFEEGRRAGLEEAAKECDRIEALEAKLRKSALQELSALGQAEDAYQAQLAVEAKLAKALEKLEYWFDTDQEVLDAMTPDERADHMRQLQMIRDTL